MPRIKQAHESDLARARLAVACVSIVFCLPHLRLDRPRAKGPMMVYARQVAMWLTHCQMGLTQTRTAELFDKDRSTVAHACSVVEDALDDPVLGKKIEDMADWLSGAPFLPVFTAHRNDGAL